MRTAIAAAVLLATTAPLAAQEKSSTTLAGELGSVLASEEFCALSYDQDAISDWIDDNVAADDMGFTGSLSLMTRGVKRRLDKLSASEKTAHCRAIERTAKHYGFAAP